MRAVWFILSGIILFIKPAWGILRNKDHTSFDPYLKKQAIATFLFTIIFIVGLNV